MRVDGGPLAGLVLRRARPTPRTRSRSSTRRCTSSAPRRSAAASSRCGTRVQTNKTSPGCSRTTPTATRSAPPGRGWRQSAGYTFVDGGAYQDGTTDYTSMISKFKAQGLRALHERAAAAGLQHLLEAGRAAGLQAEARDGRQGAAVPGRHRGARRPREQHRDRLVVGAVHAVQVLARRRRPRRTSPTRSSPRPGTQWLQTLGSTYSLFEVAKEALTAASDPHDHEAVAAQLFKVKYAGMSGLLDFTTGPHIDPADQSSPTIPGIGIVNPVGVQWRKGTQLPLGDGGRRQQPQPRRPGRGRSGPDQRLSPSWRCSSSTTSPSGSAGWWWRDDLVVVGRGRRCRRHRRPERRRQDQPVRHDLGGPRAGSGPRVPARPGRDAARPVRAVPPRDRPYLSGARARSRT